MNRDKRAEPLRACWISLMPRDRDSDKLRPDANEIAYRTVQAALGLARRSEPPGAGEKEPPGVKRGRKGGKRGGPARKAKLTAAEARRIAQTEARLGIFLHETGLIPHQIVPIGIVSANERPNGHLTPRR